MTHGGGISGRLRVGLSRSARRGSDRSANRAERTSEGARRGEKTKDTHGEVERLAEAALVACDLLRRLGLSALVLGLAELREGRCELRRELVPVRGRTGGRGCRRRGGGHLHDKTERRGVSLPSTRDVESELRAAAKIGGGRDHDTLTGPQRREEGTYHVGL